jgi:hypothetical protein
MRIPKIYAFCRRRLDERAGSNDGADVSERRARLEAAVHALRALGPETWPAAEEDVREITARFADHPEYAAFGLDDENDL